LGIGIFLLCEAYAFKRMGGAFMDAYAWVGFIVTVALGLVGLFFALSVKDVI